METSDNSRELNSNPSISSAADTPASRSVRPESAAEPTTPGIFGRSSPDFFAYLDPDTCCWKTSQATFLSGLEMFSETWPDSGTMRNGRAYALRTSGPAISGSGCSSLDTWPTAVANDDNKTPEAHLRMKQRMGERDGTGANRTAITSLQVKVQTWPIARSEDSESAGNHPGAMDSLTGATRNWATPRADDRGKVGMGKMTDTARVERESGETFALSLTDQAHLWQTPAMDSFRSRGGDRKDEMGLDQQARMFPTPTMSDATRGNFASKEKRTKGGRGKQLADQSCIFRASPPAPPIPDGQPSCESGQSSRRLSPRFVEWLLGLPIGWTEL